MARPKTAQGKKLIYQWGLGTILTLSFGALVVALYFIALFLPYMGNITGLDLFKHVFASITGTPCAVDELAANIQANTALGWGPTTVIVKVVAYIMTVNMLMMGVFTLVLLIILIVMASRGRLKNFKRPHFYTLLITITAAFYFIVPIGVNIYSALILKRAYYEMTVSCILLGLYVALTIVLHVFYLVYFKHGVYVKDEETLNRYLKEVEGGTAIVDTTTEDDFVSEEEEKELFAKKEEVPAPVVEEVITAAPIIPPMPTETKPQDEVKQEVKEDPEEAEKHLPVGLKSIGGHAFSQNIKLEDAQIPFGIDTLGAGAFANCVNLKKVFIPESVKKIEYNCFFNCCRLETIEYGSTKEKWRKIKRGSHWLTSAGTKLVRCRDGILEVNTNK